MTAHSRTHAILCGNCQQEIEHCHGALGEWMHTVTKREVCSKPGAQAQPETVEQFERRLKRNDAGRKRPPRQRSALPASARHDLEFQEWRASR